MRWDCWGGVRSGSALLFFYGCAAGVELGTVAFSPNWVTASAKKGLRVRSAWCAVSRVWSASDPTRSSMMGDFR